ncbi:MAG: DUF971 domain-containing protein [Planctomycetes bacterium]|nr:DUF971 domain-containing protein [Planctomycetota bacterium]
MLAPEKIQVIGNDVAIRWKDGSEDFYPMDKLRAASPSAETRGEHDLFGNLMGGNPGQKYQGVTVTGWKMIGGYAVGFEFSDGHSTGLYDYDYLKEIAEKMDNG